MNGERFFPQLWGYPEYYPKSADEFTDEQWRWEFLRRSAAYCEAWDNGKPIGREEPDEYYRWSPVFGLESSFRMGILVDPACDYDPQIDDNYLFNRKTGERIFTDKSYPQVLKMAEHILLPPDPVFGNPKKPSLQLKLRAALFPVISNQLQLPSFSKNWGTALAAFDLSKPLGPQLENIETQLEKAQKEFCGRPRSPRLKGDARKLWPLYLRLLDAEAMKAKPMEIFHALEKEGVEEIMGATNETSKIKGMIEAAFKVQEKVISNL
jgi:hypothetical protein